MARMYADLSARRMEMRRICWARGTVGEEGSVRGFNDSLSDSVSCVICVLDQIVRKKEKVEGEEME